MDGECLAAELDGGRNTGHPDASKTVGRGGE
jgi:hypothetical protein